MDEDQTIEEMIIEVESAEIALKDRRTALMGARHAETAAVNRMNDAQKNLTKAYDEMRLNAPPDTDWARLCKGGG